VQASLVLAKNVQKTFFDIWDCCYKTFAAMVSWWQRWLDIDLTTLDFKFVFVPTV
jgi:hypothetical protein